VVDAPFFCGDIRIVSATHIMSGTSVKIAERFGKRLRDWRKEQDLPQKAVAAELGVSAEIVSDWERGVRFPCQRHLGLITSYTQIPLCSFFRHGQCRCMQQSSSGS